MLIAMEPDISDLVNAEIDSLVDGGHGDLMELLGLITEYCREIRPRADGVISRNADNQISTVEERPEEVEYFVEMIVNCRQVIAEGAVPPHDTLTALITAELDGRVLTDNDVPGFMMFLFIDGSQTTTLLIENMVWLLLQHPEQMELVRNDRSLIPNAVEESLR